VLSLFTNVCLTSILMRESEEKGSSNPRKIPRKTRRFIMGLAGKFKDLIRRLAVTLFGVFELLGLPRIPEKREGEGGEKR